MEQQVWLDLILSFEICDVILLAEQLCLTLVVSHLGTFMLILAQMEIREQIEKHFVEKQFPIF